MELNTAYQILGLSKNATIEEIKTAYRALAQFNSLDGITEEPALAQAQAKMDELNAAFDLVIGKLRTGEADAKTASENSSANVYTDVREMISRGDADGALARLNSMPNSDSIAEWNFLVGSAYYYKGWIADALRYCQVACQLEPNNREYQAALNNLNNNANGNMHSNPFYSNGNANNAQQNMSGCGGGSCCDMCTAMMCMNMCCGCGRGGC